MTDRCLNKNNYDLISGFDNKNNVYLTRLEQNGTEKIELHGLAAHSTNLIWQIAWKPHELNRGSTIASTTLEHIVYTVNTSCRIQAVSPQHLSVLC